MRERSDETNAFIVVLCDATGIRIELRSCIHVLLIPFAGINMAAILVSGR